MTTQEKLYTAEDLLGMPDDGLKRELVNGALIEMSPPNYRHGSLAAAITYFIYAYLAAHPIGGVTVETGYILAQEPLLVRSPDVAFISKARLPKPNLEGFIPMAPDLAIEIVSPGDTAREVASKVQQYLHAGTGLVWVVYPDELLVYVHHADGNALVLDSKSALDGGEVLPGFTLPLRDLFKDFEASTG